MREIKFRAWDIYRRKMLYEVGVHPHISEAHHLDPEAGYKDGDESWTLNPSSTPFPIMQFTGLHDKNGKEIYEGDILTFKPMFARGSEMVAFIDWFNRDADYWLYFNLERTSFTGITNLFHGNEVMAAVIGNIHETPELLGKYPDSFTSEEEQATE